MSEDQELQTIRERLRAEMTAPQPAKDVIDHPVEITDEKLADFVRAHDLVVVDVWAEWCGPCRMVGPIVDQLAKEMAGQVAFAKLDADTNPAVMQAFGIQGIPTLLVFRKGRLVDRLVGAMPKASLAAAIRRHQAS
jgi:thioredoxin 1